MSVQYFPLVVQAWWPALRRFGPQMLLTAVFGVLTLPNIAYPPVFAEESLEVLLTLRALTSPEGGEALGELLPSVEILGRQFPLMEDNPYVGPIELYLQLPLFAIFGVNAFSIRLLPILVSLVGVLAAFAVCRQWFGLWPALLAGLLTVTHPVFVHFSRLGHDKEEVFTAGAFWLGLYLVDRSLRGERRAAVWLCAGGLVWGLGLSHKITFLWYVLGLAVAVALLRMRPFGGAWPRLGHALGAGACFLLGAGFTIVYNLTHRLETVRIMWTSLWTPTPKDHVVNLDYLHNLWVRLQQLTDVILAGELWAPNLLPIFGGERFLLNVPLAVLFFVAYLVLLALALLDRLPVDRHRLLFLYLVFGAVLLCSPFTVSYHHPSHLLVLYPFPQLVIGTALWVAVRAVPGRWPGPVAVAAVLILLLALNLNLVFAYHVRSVGSVEHPISAWEPITMDHAPPPPPPDGRGELEGFEPIPDRW